ncbi:MAG TPA: YciI family protein [Bryobacteraceae bacterium]|nr:YciI family protein [Bryobacteraceae bacterium]
MPQYVLFLRGDPSRFAGYGPEEMQKLIQKYGAWRQSLQNKIAAGHKLKDGEGRVLRQQSGKAVVTDGPFTEAKEVMGGLFVIEADSYDQAVELAKSCPHMEFGSIEIRAIDRIPQSSST